MILLAKILNGLTLLYIAAATVAGLQASHVAGSPLADLLGGALGAAIVALPAIPYYLSLIALIASSHSLARAARRANRGLLAVTGLLAAALLAAAPAVLWGALPFLALLAVVCAINLRALARMSAGHQGIGYSWR